MENLTEKGKKEMQNANELSLRKFCVEQSTKMPSNGSIKSVIKDAQEIYDFITKK